MRTLAALGAVLAFSSTPGVAGPPDPVEQGAIEQSCRSLAGGTAGTFDQTTNATPGAFPPTWPVAPKGLLPAHVWFRTQTETFNRLYEFATRNGQIYGRANGST